MENPLEKRIKDLKNISLSPKEEVLLRERVLSHIKEFPLTKSPVTNQVSPRLNNWQSVISGFPLLILKKSKTMVAAIISLVLALSGGVSLAAQGSLPGDVLYPVKINVNESVEAALAVSLKSKVNLEEKKANRRLSEATELVNGNRLDAKTEADLTARFKANVDNFSLKVRKLSEEDESFDAVDSTLRLESEIKAYESALRGSSLASTTKLMITVRESKQKIEKERKEYEIKLGGTVILQNNEDLNGEIKEDISSGRGVTLEAAQGKQKAAELSLSRAKEMFEKQKGSFSTNMQAKIEAQIHVSEKFIAEGKVLISTGLYAKAHENFQAAIRVANNAKVLILTSSNKIKINLDLDIEGNKENNDSEDEETGNNTEEMIEAEIKGDINIETSEGNKKIEKDNETKVEAAIKVNGEL